MAYIHGAALVTAALKFKGKRAYSSMCQAFCVTVAGTGAVGDYDGDGAADAQDGWKKAKAKGTVVLAANIKSLADVPAGTFCYWEGGSHGYGHVAISVGGGNIISTDAPTWGTIGVVSIDWITKHWGNGLVFRGYVVKDGNGHVMVDPDVKPAAIAPKTEKWTVDVAKGAVLNGRAAPVSGKVLYQRAPGYGITTVGRDPSGKWAVTRYGTWYSVAYLKARGVAQTITVKVVSWNFKSPTLNGYWPAWSKRRGGQVTIVKDTAPDVLLGQEMGSPTNVKWYDAAFAPLGLTNVKAWANGSGKWREIYHRPSFSRITSGLYTIGPRLKGDDKQMAECILRDSLGRDWYFGSAHLENDDDTGDTQVAQIADCFKRALEARDEHGVAPEHLVIGVDTNSRKKVREWVEANTDYRDAFGLTPDATRAGIKSINGWKPLANGAREDYVFIHKSLLPSEATQFDGHEVSDHNPQVVTFTA